MKDDINRNYIYVKIGYSYYEVFFREGFVYPEVFLDTVNRILWYGPDNKASEIPDKKVSVIEEEGIVSQVFDELYNNEPLSADNISAYGEIICYFDNMPGLEYFIWVRIQDGEKLMGNDSKDHYVKISDDLLEKLSGNDE